MSLQSNTSDANNGETVSSQEEPLISNENIDQNDSGENEDSEEEEEDNSKNIVVKCGCYPTFRMNHNVFLNLVLAALYGVSGSLWNGTAYAAYLKKLGRNENEPVGAIEAVSGLSSLIAALPVGFLADRYGRSRVIRAGGVLLVITGVLQIYVMEWVGVNEEENDHNRHHSQVALFWMGVLMALWGVGDGVVNGPCAALYADSTAEGDRTTYYNYLFACYIGASAVGPLLSIFMFQTLGDEWDMYDLRVVIYAGLGLEIFNAVLMMLFDDKKALEEGGRFPLPSSTNEEAVQHSENNQVQHSNVEYPGQSSDHPTATDTPLSRLQKRRRCVPYLIFIQGLIFALGSGMTVKFFPLFFKDEVGMTPSQVQVIYVCVPFAMVILSTLESKVSKAGFGRVQTCILSNVLAVSLLYVMVFFKTYLDTHPFLLVPIYVMRTSLANASYPLQESILMDFVPKDERARWKALDSVASFGWCGSAAFGGWLADKYDYTYTFMFTAILQTAGTAVWILLLPLVPRTEGQEDEAILLQSTVVAPAERHESSGLDSSLVEPLISETERNS